MRRHGVGCMLTGGKMRRKPREFEDEDFEIEDVESYRGEPEKKYSHELLVMEQYRRCLKSGSQEMRKGWEERKTDKTGMAISIKIHPDTRKEFAECVITLKNLLVGNIVADEDAEKEIKKLLEELDALLKKYVDLEEREWQKIPLAMKHPGSKWLNRWEHLIGTLNFDYVYGEKYLQESVGVYRRILEAMGLLLHRMGYFKAELR